MDVEEFRRVGKEMIDFIADHKEGIDSLPVVPDVKPGFLTSKLPTTAPEKGEDWNKIFNDVEELIVPGMTNWQHSNFHAYFPAGNSYPSILGELLESALGCIGFSWAASPACTELEIAVMDWLGAAIGLPNQFLHRHGKGGGVIQGSASESVIVSMLAARSRAFEKHNLSSGTRLVAYCSELAHSSVEKAASICNITLRKLPTNSKYSLNANTLSKAIKEDLKRNLIPFYACLTLGTTSVCSFDDVYGTSLLLEESHYKDMWLHIDSAYAGNALICPEFRYLIQNGIQRVDSLEFNANKWMLTNFDCGCMWVKNRVELENALSVDPLYLKHDFQHLTKDFRNWGIPLSRRFRALKLWFVLRSYGICGIQSYIREHIRLAKRFTKLLSKDSRFEQIGRTTMGLVCFRLKGENHLNEKLLEVINGTGCQFMVPANVKDKFIIRYAICSPTACDADIDYSWEIISHAADRVHEDNCMETSVDADRLPLSEVINMIPPIPNRCLSMDCENPSKQNNKRMKIVRRYSSADKFSIGMLGARQYTALSLQYES